MKTHFTFAAFAIGASLFASAALADGTMAPANTMAPATTNNAMAPNNTMAPASGGMMGGMTAHKPKPHKKTPPANTNAMAPAGSNTMTPASGGMGGH